jgi:hypothetical protein
LVEIEALADPKAAPGLLVSATDVDKPAYQAVAKRHHVRVPRIISITRPDQVLGFGGSDFSPETIQHRADEGYKQTAVAPA